MRACDVAVSLITLMVLSPSLLIVTLVASHSVDQRQVLAVKPGIVTALFARRQPLGPNGGREWRI